VQRVGARRTTVAQVVEDREPLLDDIVGAAALDVRDEADAARVVLVGRIVEALLPRQPVCGFHLEHLSIVRRRGRAQSKW